MKVHREAPRSAAMAAHRANDVAHELALLTQAANLPEYLVALTLERLGENVARLLSDIEDMRGALGRREVSETATFQRGSGVKGSDVWA
jgi:hypothetical protein